MNKIDISFSNFAGVLYSSMPENTESTRFMQDLLLSIVDSKFESIMNYTPSQLSRLKSGDRSIESIAKSYSGRTNIDKCREYFESYPKESVEKAVKGFSELGFFTDTDNFSSDTADLY